MVDYGELLSRAHVDFSSYVSVPAGCADDALELQWRRELLHSPNGGLITHNAFFTALGEPTIWLAHVTSNVRAIEKSGLLRLSAGSLVGTVYCVPAYREGDIFSLHNLGNWIRHYEIPAAAGAVGRAPIDVILIEVRLAERYRTHPIGIDYTQLGDFHYVQYMQLRRWLTRPERELLEAGIAQKIAAAKPFLAGIEEMDLRHEIGPAAAKRFINAYAACASTLPILGYLYFEALVEYVLCYQNDAASEQAAGQGEFYAHYYKMVAQDVRAALFQEFRLSSFAPQAGAVIAVLRKYAAKGLVFTAFSEAHFLQFLARRLGYLVRSRCVRIEPAATAAAGWCFKGVPERYLPLAGHLLNLDLRTLPRSLELYYRFGKARAERVWSYWDEIGVAVPFNAILPRGEVGINPNYCTGRTSTLYKAATRDGGRTFSIDRRLNAALSHELVNPKYTVMGYKKKHHVNQAR